MYEQMSLLDCKGAYPSTVWVLTVVDGRYVFVEVVDETN